MNTIIDNAHFGVERSRGLILATTRALGVHADAVTVVGAHAVHAWARTKWGDIDMESTRDGDLVINPVFVAEQPSILEAMQTIGLEPAGTARPGIYGFPEEADLDWSQRTTIDLIVPEAYAGGGGKQARSARMAGQNKAASRARGLEIAIHDRHLMELPALDRSGDAIDVHIAGPAALLIAKAHKVGERMAEFDTHPDRVKAKDSGDVALLMMVSDGASSARTIAAAVEADPIVADAARAGARYLIDLYSASGAVMPREDAVESLAARFDEEEVLVAIDGWLDAFITEGNAAGLIGD